MTTKLVTAIVSAIVAATALTTAANAGGDGVRLPFGYPLGSFKATPARGGDAAVMRRARKTPARHEAYAPPKHTPRSDEAAKPDKAATAAAEPSPAVTDETPPVTGSSALIQSDIPAHSAEAPAKDAEPAVTTTAGNTTQETETCKKFIPALGTTVSVACGQ